MSATSPARPIANPVATPRRRSRVRHYGVGALGVCIALLGASWLELHRGDVGAFWIALVSTGLGERDAAYDWLDRSVADRSLSGGPFNPSQDTIAGPLFADLRGQTRFERLRQRLGLRPAHPAA